MGTKKTSSKTYIVSWYGPFHSIEEMEEWQCSNEGITCCLYMIQGKKTHAKSYHYYCGQTTRSITKRLTDKDHHIHEIPNKRSIWIGTFENRYSKEDINIAENMFIHLLTEKKVPCLNQQSLFFPPKDYNIFLTCRWHNPNRHRQPEYSIKRILPEVVVYFFDTDEVKIANRLHNLIF